MALYVLFESASGYGLFEAVEKEEVASLAEEVQNSVLDLQKFSKIIKFKAFQPFKSAENALENINAVSEGIMTDDLQNFLEMNLPKVKAGKKAKFSLGVIEPKVGQAVQERLNFPCKSNETILEIIRGIRLHFHKFVHQLDNGGLEKAQLGLGHSYSRAKVKFNVNRADNMIIQSISLLDQLDKDLNTFAMRVREWYSWHFPELVRIVNDNYVYARCAAYIGDRSKLTEEKLQGLEEIVMDEEKAKSIIQAAKMSMGMDMSDIDMVNVHNFTTRLIKLAEYRKQLHEYLVSKMQHVAPNLGALIGEMVAARLISHAGSLTNLAKCPASTVQILGAEKALFRALKTRGNTPKYGLIFHSSFIGRASAKNKGRISRYLANKCSIASRIDSFIDEPTTKYGEKMRDQVEERLAFYDTGATPKKNVDVMAEVAGELAKAKKKAEKKKKKRKLEEEDGDQMEEQPEPKSAKKSKKAKKEKAEEETPVPEEIEDKESKKSEKKKKKKKSKD